MKQCSKDQDRAPDKHQARVCQNRYELHYESCQSTRNSQSQTTGCMSTAQHRTAQHSRAQHSTAEQSTAQHSIAHLDAHGFQAPLKSPLQHSKGQSRLCHQTSLLQENSARRQRHAIQKGGHFLLGPPNPIPCRRVLMVFQPAPCHIMSETKDIANVTYLILGFVTFTIMVSHVMHTLTVSLTAFPPHLWLMGNTSKLGTITHGGLTYCIPKHECTFSWVI